MRPRSVPRATFRAVSRAFAVALAIVIASVACAPAKAPLAGTDLGGGAAPDFTLVDGRSGSTITLSALRGDVVAIAFLYTHCPDVCPLTAEHFRQAQRALGDGAKVTFLAVSVDPEHDTPQATREFSDAHGLRDRWHYLIGPRSGLEPVWRAYGVGAQETGTPIVEHNDAIFLVDAKGRERVLMHSDDAVDDLVRNLRALLAEG